MKYYIVVHNDRKSPFQRNKRLASHLEKVFTAAGHDVVLRLVAPKRFPKAVAKAIASEADYIIAGGTRTPVSQAAKQVHGTDKVFGVLPFEAMDLEDLDSSGSGDLLTVARQLLGADTVDVDLMKVNGELCLCSTVIGFYPALREARGDLGADTFRHRAVMHLRGLLTVIRRLRSLRLRITTAGKTKFVKARMTAFSPGHQIKANGLLPIRHDQKPGSVSAYVDENLGSVEMIGTVIDESPLKLIDTNRMTLLASSEMEIDVQGVDSLPATIDGKLVSLSIPCRMSIEKESLRVLRPASAA